jgi:hypothetical protein
MGLTENGEGWMRKSKTNNVHLWTTDKQRKAFKQNKKKAHWP